MFSILLHDQIQQSDNQGLNTPISLFELPHQNKVVKLAAITQQLGMPTYRYP